jgi:hypothetical protein
MQQLLEDLEHALNAADPQWFRVRRRQEMATAKDTLRCGRPTICSRW